jgi:hypothetical protein
VGRFVVRSGLLLLAGFAPACLLYTDPINSPPQVMMVAPQSFVSNRTATFHGTASDPDGDQVTLIWAMAYQGCKSGIDWQSLPTKAGEDFEVTPKGHEPFCVRLVAEDRYGARSLPKEVERKAQNRAPATTLAVDPPQGTASFPLYTSFRLTAGPARDDDGDAVEFTWKGTDPMGTDMGMSLTACDPAHPEEVRCFSADRPGAYSISVEASDGLEGGAAMAKVLTLPVLEDGPPCIEVTSPAADTGVVVLAVNAPPRAFEVRRVRDDGNPFPAGPTGAASFQWFTRSEGAASWIKAVGYDRPVFDVSAARFDDVRPGSVYKVQVEVRDPQHESASELNGLKAACGETPICTMPDKCIRWVTWSVRFQ